MTPRFVVHEHHASHLHYDFRLELERVLRSWVIPKGPSMDPSEKRLALLVEDHPLEYIDFEGIIPKGHYGAGAVVIWDRGSLELVEHKEGKITFFLKGENLQGAFTLTLLKGRGKGNQWLLPLFRSYSTYFAICISVLIRSFTTVDRSEFFFQYPCQTLRLPPLSWPAAHFLTASFRRGRIQGLRHAPYS
jgi:bifunctional non-homologous end joining protein LigD